MPSTSYQCSADSTAPRHAPRPTVFGEVLGCDERVVERLLEHREVIDAHGIDRVASAEPEQVLARIDLLPVLPLGAVEDARMSTAEADETVEHLRIVECERPTDEAPPVVADEHEARVPEVLDETPQILDRRPDSVIVDALRLGREVVPVSRGGSVTECGGSFAHLDELEVEDRLDRRRRCLAISDRE